ncbi:uncharacterized protein [Argopecten irradians]|uniref:uncharacterized protein n=1 Tax=Argopecten irradians TaxID=31199 RepID=UPI003721FC88
MDILAGHTPQMDWCKTDLVTAWKSFKQHVEFMFSGPLKKKGEVEKCSYFMLWIGEKGRNIYSTWTLTADEGKLLKTYYDRFESYVKPRSNVIYNRYRFHSKQQSEGETFEQFVTELQVLVKDCNYDNSDEMVRDRIVFGVKNPKVRKKLINIGSDLTLAKALVTARNYELSHAQARDMSKIDLEEVNMVAKSKFKKKSDVSVKP